MANLRCYNKIQFYNTILVSIKTYLISASPYNQILRYIFLITFSVSKLEIFSTTSRHIFHTFSLALAQWLITKRLGFINLFIRQCQQKDGNVRWGHSHSWTHRSQWSRIAVIEVIVPAVELLKSTALAHILWQSR